MRTTVNIDEMLLARARDRARQEGVTLGRLVEESLQAHLTAPSGAARVAFPTFSGGGGLRPGIDPSSNASLLDDDRSDSRRKLGLE